MQTEALDRYTALDDAIRNHLTVASQMFLHELILQEWGATGIWERIDREFCPDMSRAFRLLEHLLASGGRVELGTSDGAYSKHLPKVGTTVPDMLATMTFRDFDQAIQLANDSPYRLGLLG
ncbi:MAG: hypothetical protein O6949_08160 [Chloroflexi bacterium]|nr:hypothetical protein [Chloroflexota bacterium]